MLFHAKVAKVAKVATGAKALPPDQNFCSNGMNPLGAETNCQLPAPSSQLMASAARQTVPPLWGYLR